MGSKFFHVAGLIVASALFVTSCASGVPKLSQEHRIRPPAEPPYWEFSDWTGLKKLSYIGSSDPVSLYVLALDLSSPALEFVFTLSPQDADAETGSLKTTVFAAQNNLTAAINGAPYANIGFRYLMNRSHSPCDISGLYIYDGTQTSTPFSDYDALYLLEDGSWMMDSQESIPEGTQWAVGGFHIFLKDGINVGYHNLRHPRTAIGFSGDKKTMYLLVADGRQKDCAGMTLKELGEWMLWLGASYGISMDGGGSSTLILREDHKLRILNSPVHGGIAGVERSVGSHIGFRLSVPAQ